MQPLLGKFVRNKEDLKNFEKKIFNFLSLKNNSEIEYSAEPKIDGISASLIYKDGKFVKGYLEEMEKKEKILLKISLIKIKSKIINIKNFPD